MDQITVSLRKVEELRKQLPILRQDESLDGRLAYYRVMWKVTDLQHNMYIRLMLIGDEESREVAAQMQKVAEDYMQKPSEDRMEDFFNSLKEDILHQIKVLTCLKDTNTYD